ncbi:unnamed protein product [Leptosia nina]|uniref:Leprecan-like alpha-helical domain-containing protein n=1 Tax=Leptosia nina TaxID=320188 RepID=A0AAV1IW58_9NEOP
MLWIKVHFVLLINIFLVIEGAKFSSLDLVYQKAVEAYSNERWSECIVQFEEALHLYKLYKRILINCRLKCKHEAMVSNIKDNIEDLKIYEMYFTTRVCLIKCNNQAFEEVHIYNNVTESTIYNMQIRKPYEYLHLCYFQMNAMPKAASASYTFLVSNPDDPKMKKNLDYYVEQPEVDVNEVVDLESDDYQILYRLGLKSYNSKNWGETIAYMEESLNDYLSWENNCRTECERQPEQEWSPEVTITISNYIESLLSCKQRCQHELKPLYSSGVEFLADLLNYLQISYYNLDRFEDMGKAVATYLLLLPEDEDMLENKNIYKTLIDEKSFTERSEVVHYLKRDTYEKQLFKFFHQENSHNDESNTIL